MNSGTRVRPSAVDRRASPIWQYPTQSGIPNDQFQCLKASVHWWRRVWLTPTPRSVTN
ncbi:TPA: hypothetical protein ACNB17_003326 [Escherichia coli]